MIKPWGKDDACSSEKEETLRYTGVWMDGMYITLKCSPNGKGISMNKAKHCAKDTNNNDIVWTGHEELSAPLSRYQVGGVRARDLASVLIKAESTDAVGHVNWDAEVVPCSWPRAGRWVSCRTTCDECSFRNEHLDRHDIRSRGGRGQVSRLQSACKLVTFCSIF